MLRLPGADILIDAGPPNAGREAVLPFLRACGIGRLDLAVITHPDLDHYGGLAWLAGRIPIGAVVGNGDSADTRAWRELRGALAERGIPWREAEAGQLLYRYGDLRLEVISPGREARFPERNDNSLVCLLRLTRGTRASDRRHGPCRPGAPARPRARRPAKGRSSKFPITAAIAPPTSAFLAALRPEAAVISAGRRNRFGHPGPGNLETLRRAGARLFLTPEHGAVRYREDGRGAGWETFLPDGTPGRNM